MEQTQSMKSLTPYDIIKWMLKIMKNNHELYLTEIERIEGYLNKIDIRKIKIEDITIFNRLKDGMRSCTSLINTMSKAGYQVICMRSQNGNDEIIHLNLFRTEEDAKEHYEAIIRLEEGQICTKP